MSTDQMAIAADPERDRLATTADPNRLDADVLSEQLSALVSEGRRDPVPTRIDGLLGRFG